MNSRKSMCSGLAMGHKENSLCPLTMTRQTDMCNKKVSNRFGHKRPTDQRRALGESGCHGSQEPVAHNPLGFKSEQVQIAFQQLSRLMKRVLQLPETISKRVVNSKCSHQAHQKPDKTRANSMGYWNKDLKSAFTVAIYRTKNLETRYEHNINMK